MKVLRIKSAAARLGLSSRTLHRWSTDPRYASLGFPRPVSLGENSRGYLENEIDEFIKRRAALRTASVAKIVIAAVIFVISWSLDAVARGLDAIAAIW